MLLRIGMSKGCSDNYLPKVRECECSMVTGTRHWHGHGHGIEECELSVRTEKGVLSFEAIW
jgi:hypothetical protein